MTRNDMSTAISPLAPACFPEMPQVAGVRLATAAAGIRYAGRADVFLALFDAGTAVAGVFTRSKCPSAPVDWCRARLKSGGGGGGGGARDSSPTRVTPMRSPASPAGRRPS